MTQRAVWIWGRHSVLEALRAGTVHRILLAEGRKPAPVLREILELAQRQHTPVREVPPREIDLVAAGQNTQGVVAEVTEVLLGSVGALLERVPGTAAPFLLALDQVQDPHNVGALIRTAEAAGVHGIIVPRRRSAPLSGVVAKTSAGAVSYLPLAEVANLVHALDEVRKAGIWTVGLEGAAPLSIFAADLRGPICLIVGGEGSGLRRLTREHADVQVHIPMRGHVRSLNASVAGSIALYEVVRQRLAAP